MLAFVLAGCGESPPPLSRLAPDATILAFGDSLTRGTGAPGDASYPSVLADLSGRRVVNAGLPGELSADGLSRLPALLEAERPALMVLCHGGNDMLRKRNVSAAAANVRAMIDLARSRGVDVLLVGVPKPGLLMGTAGFYSDVAREAGVPAELDVIADVLSDAALKSDPIHPNAAGYAAIARAIHRVLQSSGAL